MPTYRSEADVKKEIKRLLKAHGWFSWMPAANAYGRSGASDHLAIKSGAFLAIEAKFAPNAPTPVQILFLRNIHHHDGMAFVVNQHTIEHLATWLQLFDKAAVCASRGEAMEEEEHKDLLNAFGHLTAPVHAVLAKG
jgi:Holliday junction resolvase